MKTIKNKVLKRGEKKNLFRFSSTWITFFRFSIRLIKKSNLQIKLFRDHRNQQKGMFFVVN